MVQMIKDHSSWIGKGKDGTVFPQGVKMKGYSSAEGAGHEADYEDTSDKIKAQQEMGKKKVQAHPQKALYRN